MRITNRRLCRIGTGRGFYVPDKYLTDEHIDEYFDLIVLPKLSEKDQTIKHQLIDLMKQHPKRTWVIQELSARVMEWLNTSYQEAKQYVISLLEKIPEIEKVYDVKFANFGDGSSYRLID